MISMAKFHHEFGQYTSDISLPTNSGENGWYTVGFFNMAFACHQDVCFIAFFHTIG